MTGIIAGNLNRSSGTIKEASGGIDYDTTAKTSNFNAESGRGYFVDTSSSAITATLPASAETGDIIAFKDYTGTFNSNNLTIARNGHKIQGNATNSLISTIRASVVLVYVDSTKGWLFTVESNVGDRRAAEYVAATGGTITTTGNFKVHTFTSSGTFEVTSAGNDVGSNTVDYLVVAGGGGGGGSAGGGGGGGGGFREGRGNAPDYTASPLVSSSALPVTAQEYPITIGGGGSTSGNCNPGGSGGNSVFSTITSAGGGGGGFGGDAGNRVGVNGGSGGGGGGGPSSPSFLGGSGNTPPVSPPQGSDGGDGVTNTKSGGGGGGAVGAGGDAPGSAGGGSGGAGTTTSIPGSPIGKAGGGGGGSHGPGPGAGGSAGSNGGAAGGTAGPAPNVAPSASNNTGGGGGGAAGQHQVNPGTSGAGGSGIVVIRYKFQN